MKKLRWWIPGNVPSSKNGRRWTGKYFIASKAVMNYRKATKDIYLKYITPITPHQNDPKAVSAIPLLKSLFLINK